MTTQTQPPPLTLNLIDLASLRPDMDWSRENGALTHDYRTFRVLSRGDLPHSAVQNIVKQNPGYTCVGINSYPYISDADAPF